MPPLFPFATTCLLMLLVPGDRTRPRVQGSAPSLNPPTDGSDEGVADCTRGRVRSPEFLPTSSGHRGLPCATGVLRIVLMCGWIMFCRMMNHLTPQPNGCAAG